MINGKQDKVMNMERTANMYYFGRNAPGIELFKSIADYVDFSKARIVTFCAPDLDIKGEELYRLNKSLVRPENEVVTDLAEIFEPSLDAVIACIGDMDIEICTRPSQRTQIIKYFSTSASYAGLDSPYRIITLTHHWRQGSGSESLPHEFLELAKNITKTLLPADDYRMEYTLHQDNEHLASRIMTLPELEEALDDEDFLKTSGRPK